MKTFDHAGGRILSHVNMSDECIEAAKALLDAGNILYKAEQLLMSKLPSDVSFQFYGKWDCLIIRQNDNE